MSSCLTSLGNVCLWLLLPGLWSIQWPVLSSLSPRHCRELEAREMEALAPRGTQARLRAVSTLRCVQRSNYNVVHLELI